MDTLVHDVRYALRTLARTPAFTLAAVATLALGIGANSALFTVLQRALLARLPVDEPDRLVQVVTDRGPDGINHNLSLPKAQALREGIAAFSGVAAHSAERLAAGFERGAEQVEGAVVSRGFFATFGVRLALGREFVAEEDTRGGPAVVVLSHALWRSRFGGREDVLGQTLTLNGQPFTIVGVAAAPFRGPVAGRSEALWIPVASVGRVSDADFELSSPNASWLDVFARLAPGVTLEQARAAMALFDREQARAGRGRAAEHTRLIEASRGLTYAVNWLKGPLTFLFALVGLVLLLACTNVANLLIARAAGRRREVAIRLAVGAGRGRLVRQFMTESFLLAAVGGAAALLVARWGADYLLAYESGTSGGRLDLATNLDRVVIGFTALLTLATGFAFGLLPALRASRPDVVPALKGAERPWQERLFGLRGSLVVVQVAISMVLVAGASLFLRSLHEIGRVDIGFTPGPVLLASVNLEQAGYDRDRGMALQARLLERLGRVPGVAVAGAAGVITPNPGGSNWGGTRIEGYTPPPGEVTSFDVNRVAPGYFEALGIRLMRGRAFGAGDVRGAPPAMIVNEAFARKYFAGRDPIGRHIYVGAAPNERAIEIVGIAPDGKYRELRETEQANVYFPLLQQYQPDITFAIRTRGEDAGALAGAVRAEIRAVDAALPVFDVRTLAEHVAIASAQDRMMTTLSSAFGAVALLLAGLGLFGVIAYAVAQRTREIGVRVALGASAADVVGMVVGRGAALAGAGLVIGLIAALPLGRLASGLLYGIAPADPLALAAAATLLVAAAGVASWLPARRAARIDPMIAIRSE